MMAIAIPDVIQHEAAMMWIEGGNNGPSTGPSPPSDDLVGLAVQIAENTGAIGAYIRQVPNQGMVFTVRNAYARMHRVGTMFSRHLFVTSTGG